MNVEEWYGEKTLSSIMESSHLVRSNTAPSVLSRELPSSHDQFHVNPFYGNGRGRLTSILLIVSSRLGMVEMECVPCWEEIAKMSLTIMEMVMYCR